MPPRKLNIVSATYANEEQTTIEIVVADMPPDARVFVPTDPRNRDFVAVQAWVGEGHTIAPYVAPPPPPASPTSDELLRRIEALEAKRK